MKKILGLMLFVMTGLVGESFSASITKTISSTTFVNGFAASDVLVLNPNESLTYRLTGGATGTIYLEKSIDGSNYIAIVSSVNNSATGVRTGVDHSNDLRSFYRWRASTMTGVGSFVVYLDDNDDPVAEIKNRKFVPSVSFTDERLYMPTLRFEPETEAGVLLSSTTELTRALFPKSFALVSSTGGAISLTARPTISTATALPGDIYVIQSSSVTITFSDDGTLARSALELGSTTRALGIGDILVLIYRAGKWWEMGFYNN